MRYEVKIGLLIGVLALMVVGLIYVSTLYIVQTNAEDLRRSQLAACERGNDLRRAVRENAEVLRDFAARAAVARDQSATAAVGLEALQNAAAAEAYRQLGNRVEDVPETHCESLLP